MAIGNARLSGHRPNRPKHSRKSDVVHHAFSCCGGSRDPTNVLIKHAILRETRLISEQNMIGNDLLRHIFLEANGKKTHVQRWSVGNRDCILWRLYGCKDSVRNTCYTVFLDTPTEGATTHILVVGFFSTASERSPRVPWVRTSHSWLALTMFLPLNM